MSDRLVGMARILDMAIESQKSNADNAYAEDDLDPPTLVACLVAARLLGMSGEHGPNVNTMRIVPNRDGGIGLTIRWREWEVLENGKVDYREWHGCKIVNESTFWEALV